MDRESQTSMEFLQRLVSQWSKINSYVEKLPHSGVVTGYCGLQPLLPSSRPMHYLGTSPSIHQMSSDFHTSSSHITTVICSPIPQYPINLPLYLYRIYTVSVGYSLCIPPAVTVPASLFCYVLSEERLVTMP